MEEKFWGKCGEGFFPKQCEILGLSQNKKANAVDRILSTVLEAGDRPFYEAAYQNSLEGQMKANVRINITIYFNNINITCWFLLCFTSS